MRVFLLLLLFQILAISSQGRNITFDDLYGFPAFQDPQVSPDGQQIVFVLRTNDLTDNSRQSRLWLMNKDGGELHELNVSEGSTWNPRWDAEGKSIWYLSSNDGITQIGRYWLESQEAQQVTSISSAVSEFFVCLKGIP